MRLADNVELLLLPTVLANGPGVLSLLMVWDDKDVVLFDAGQPGMADDIRRAATNAGVPFDRLNHVLITHSDMDHIGSLSQIIKEANNEVTVMAHSQEKPYIECERQPIRLAQMEKGLKSLQGELRVQMEQLAHSLKQNYKKLFVKVSRTLEDNERLPICGGIEAIHTPGHTPGHMSYYLKQFKLLVAGDVLQAENGHLSKCPDMTVLDKEAVVYSLKKLSRYDIETVVCYHGGLYHGDASGQIAQILDRMS